MSFSRESQGQHGVHFRGDEAPFDAVGKEPKRLVDQLRPVVEHRQVEADHRLRFGHQTARRERVTRAAGRTEQQVPTECGQCLEVLLEDVAAVGFDQHIHAASRGQLQNCGRPIRVVVADGSVSTELQDEVAAFLRAGGADHRRGAQRLADLDREATDPAAAPCTNNASPGHRVVDAWSSKWAQAACAAKPASTVRSASSSTTAHSASAALASLAYAPFFMSATTRRPTRSPLAPGPISTTVPATAIPPT